MLNRTLTDAFTRQADSFNRSSGANAGELLDQIVELARPADDEHWLEAACGPGIIARRIAPLVARIDGVDATPAIVELARREAAAQGLGNARFELGDVTRLDTPDASYDGVVSRFSLHHIPAPGRVFDEAARVLKPGGRAVLVDHLADDDPESFAWSQEVERLRDPSHWLSLPVERARRLGRDSGLELSDERILAMDFDLQDWLERGASGPEAADLVRQLISRRPAGTACFRIRGDALRLQIWMSAWRKPAG